MELQYGTSTRAFNAELQQGTSKENIKRELRKRELRKRKGS
jgi:hypothetical protein